MGSCPLHTQHLPPYSESRGQENTLILLEHCETLKKNSFLTPRNPSPCLESRGAQHLALLCFLSEQKKIKNKKNTPRSSSAWKSQHLLSNYLQMCLSPGRFDAIFAFWIFPEFKHLSSPSFFFPLLEVSSGKYIVSSSKTLAAKGEGP